MPRDLFGHDVLDPLDDGPSLTFAARELHQTIDGILLLAEGRKVWLPKQHARDNGDGTFTVPEWLAEEKELG